MNSQPPQGTPTSYFDNPPAEYLSEITAGHAREWKLAAELKSDGWGIVQHHPLTYEARTYLTEHGIRSPLREWPDIVAIKAPHIVMIEVKSTLAPNALIAVKQVEDYRRLAALGTLLIVWLHEDSGTWWGLNAEQLTGGLLGAVNRSTNSQGHDFYRIDPENLASLTALLPIRKNPAL